MVRFTHQCPSFSVAVDEMWMTPPAFGKEPPKNCGAIILMVVSLIFWSLCEMVPLGDME